MSARFVADVGGTNIRVARVTESGVTDIQKYLCQEFASIDLAISQYFSEHPEHKFTQGCIAIACPVLGDQVAMTNHSWAFSQTALKQQLKLDALFVINDFTAVAHSLPVLSGDQVIQIGEGTAVSGGNIAVFGPGTGLGVEHITMTSTGWQTLDGEGGHVDFAPVDETDVVIWRHLYKTFGRASAEEVMSGRGIVNIYTALAGHHEQPARFTEPAQITEKALDGSCDICAAALTQFCRIMGSFAGNLALNMATTGGVFIGGGIATRFTDYIRESDFRARFEAKGQMKHYVKDIPTYLIAEPDHGLLGASAYLQQHTAS
ncbi:glucokinase [Alteromonas aestuariivivens]|uniref:Glucokinase n=1 Tax=Alteromonas aestuariivivens TaxID=1938339 RepID=A0A3D8M926_9ALTE|nr:glucokinase [Alteromonas aestuariivivens]RDV26153.1 glucokinase [Alteromonas aestuariivivens]